MIEKIAFLNWRVNKIVLKMIFDFRYHVDLEDIQSEFERVNTQVAVSEKKLVTFDKVDWKNYFIFLFFYWSKEKSVWLSRNWFSKKKEESDIDQIKLKEILWINIF